MVKKNKIRRLCILVTILPLLVNSNGRKDLHTSSTGTLKITFQNTVKGSSLALNSAVYTNLFSEQYTVTKFKYYISHVSISGKASLAHENNSYHLIDEKLTSSRSFSFTCKQGTYETLDFMIGVDSLHNVSGAQTGALDPMNDMFWTWNTGYVMAKMEGNSPQSTIVNNKVEYHIGGFSGVNSVLKMIRLSLSSIKPLLIHNGRTSEIFIDADLDKWWQSPNDLRIANTPACTGPGSLARMIADNYSKMFTIKNVVNR